MLVYKVVGRIGNENVSLMAGYGLPLEAVIRYKIGEVAKPAIPNSLIFVFDVKPFSVSGNKRLLLCETDKIVSIPYRLCTFYESTYTTYTTYKEFWEHKDNTKRETVWCAESVFGCEWLKPIKDITE